MTLPPPSPAARTCSPSRAKSAERIDGASSIKPELSEPDVAVEQGNSVPKFYHALECGAGTPARELPGIASGPGLGSHGFSEAAYAAIAAMSSTVSPVMAGFIARTPAPA